MVRPAIGPDENLARQREVESQCNKCFWRTQAALALYFRKIRSKLSKTIHVPSLSCRIKAAWREILHEPPPHPPPTTQTENARWIKPISFPSKTFGEYVNPNLNRHSLVQVVKTPSADDFARCRADVSSCTKENTLCEKEYWKLNFC